MTTVTLKRIGPPRSLPMSRYRLTHSALPGKSWVYGFQQMKIELTFSCHMHATEARDMLFSAYASGEAVREVG